MKRTANVCFTAALNHYVIIPVKMRPVRQPGEKRNQCGKMTESRADAVNWRKAEPMRQNDGKQSQCDKLAESAADAAK